MEVSGSKLKFVAKILGFLLGFSVLGFLLLVISYTLPRGTVVAHAKEAASYYENCSAWAPGLDASVRDCFSDAIIVGSAAYDQNSNPVESAVLVRQYGYDGASPIQSFSTYYGNRQSSKEVVSQEYPRYWHGYLVFLVPLLEKLNPVEITFINALFQFSLIAVIIALAYKRYGIKLAACLGVFFASLSPVSVALSIQCSTVFYPTAIAILLILLLDQWLRQKNRYWFFFLLLGSTTVYLDLLTYPLVSLGVPLALVFYLRNYDIKRPKDIIPPLRTGALASALWLLGYAGTWALKWAISSIILSRNMFIEAIDQMKFRTSGEFGHYDTIQRNFDTMFNSPMKLFLIILFAIILVLFIAKKIRFRWQKWNLLPFLIIAAFPFVWYYVLCNHSYIHSWFTYRELSILVFAASLAIASSISRRQLSITRISTTRKTTNKKGKKK